MEIPRMHPPSLAALDPEFFDRAGSALARIARGLVLPSA